MQESSKNAALQICVAIYPTSPDALMCLCKHTGGFFVQEQAFAASASTVFYKVISAILMKSNLIASLVTCWTNTSLKSLNPTGKCYIQTRFQHFVVVFKTQKTPTTLQVKMYSNGCQNAQWE